ncbi:MAG: FlgD immunoglobulin-like domain containing protein [Candidatus Eisenbacteria bacterium]|nr:FlgD immunoglobulin-like domain containing protein [Candidatus Eisenbacteria bacterium]
MRSVARLVLAPGLAPALAPVLAPVLALALCSILAAPCLSQPAFTPLGFLDGDFGPSIAFGVSPDGSTVVGESNSSQGIQAFRWRRAEGMIGLGDIPGGPFASFAYACSADGSIVVGASDDATSGEEGTPFRWTEESGMVPLGTLGGPTSYGQADAITPDGSVIVGASQAPDGIFAFRWTEQTGMASLGDFAGGPALSRAAGVDAAGQLVVGTGSKISGYDQAFRWTSGGGMVALGSNNFATAVTPDGTVIVGSDFQGVYRWTQQTGFVHLGRLYGNLGIDRARAVSADGSVIVGLANYDATLGTGAAFVWDSGHGMRDLNLVLANDYGLDLQGLYLLWALGISADGKVISGYGFNPGGEQEAWVADLRESTGVANGGPFGVDAAARPHLTWSRPNPFTSSTTIAFRLPRETPVSLRIFNSAGRLVRTLLDGESLQPGVHASTWDGSGTDGRTVPAGTYFYRLEADGRIETGKTIAVR